MKTNKTTIKGVILAGGKSTRMGRDKGLIKYFGKPHRIYLYELLSNHLEEVRISCRKNQASEIRDEYPIIEDEFKVSSPMNGILSALQSDRKASWLVLATDLPFIRNHTIERLLGERNPKKLATAYRRSDSEKPEPLIAIWEPAAFTYAREYVKSGNTCPRRFLSGEDIKTILPYHDLELMNANNPTDLQKVKQKMSVPDKKHRDPDESICMTDLFMREVDNQD